MSLSDRDPQKGLRRTGAMKRTGGMKSMSSKKRREIRTRQTIEFQRGTCELAGYRFKCWGRIERHEIVRRSQDSTAALNAAVVIGLCSAHHRLDLHRDEAIRLGIRVSASSDEWHRADAEERAVFIEEAAVKRHNARSER